MNRFKIKGGITGKILRVDLSAEKVRVEENIYAERWIAGRALSSWILLNEMDPTTKWSDPENYLIFGAGALIGTIAPASCRTNIDTINVFNNGKGSSNVGGHFSPEMKFAGFDQIIIKGKAEKPVYLFISDGKAEIRDASHLWGKSTYETEDILKKELRDNKIEIASIGPAGENLVHGSAIIIDCGRAAGGSGVGCVMGDKKLKAIVVRGHNSVKVAHPEEFLQRAYEAYQKIIKRPTAKVFRKKTLAGMVYNDSEQFDDLWEMMHSIKNSQDVHWSREQRSRIMGKEGVGKFFKKIQACYACPVGCQPYSEINEGKFKGSKGLGYWINSVMWSGKMDVTDPEASLRYHLRANQLGLDGDDSSVVMSWAFEAYEKGLLTKEDVDGLILTWGNSDAMLELQEKIASRDGFGDFLADGVVAAAKKLGKGSEKFAINQKGQDTLDPYRVCKGWSLACATSPIAGRHMRGSINIPIAFGPKGVKFNPYSYEDQPPIVFWELRAKEIEDITGICVYVGTWSGVYALEPSDYVELTNLALGINLTEEDFMLLGQKGYNLEKAFNTIHVGFKREDDLPHRRFFEDPILSGPHKGETLNKEKYNSMLDAFYELHGWDKETSWQTRKTLESLGLSDVAEKLAEVGRLIE
ncbi:MAG: aldehyde ferredoxin oxidoreductase family protein [Candidatus Lokiarchaeota archaeon]|nr:aldehyde ferredoxin oxidoreductase family protein [Candidatus Lokiarchaeota archaeon]MCK4280642.1 aldehyde ferredoxin oxidoreductase family protein [Candidatus Lokiarchaeota archaeon]